MGVEEALPLEMIPHTNKSKAFYKQKYEEK